jgi:hypothetical protein
MENGDHHQDRSTKEWSGSREEAVYCRYGCGNKVRPHGFGLQDVCSRPRCQNAAVRAADDEKR